MKGHNWGLCKKCGKDHGPHPKGTLGKKLNIANKEEKNRKIGESNKISILNLWRDPEYRNMQSEVHKNTWKDPEYQQRMSDAHKGNPGFWMGKIREDMIANWKNPQWRNEIIKNILEVNRKLPSSAEKKLINICGKYELPLKYVGNGQLIVGGINPDFVETSGKKIVVEVFGRFWHDITTNPKVPKIQLPKTRSAIYHKFEWKCLFIWEEELTNEEVVVNKIWRFLDENMFNNS